MQCACQPTGVPCFSSRALLTFSTMFRRASVRCQRLVMQWQGRAAHQQLRAAVGGGAGLHPTAAASTRFAAAAATAKRAVTTQLSAPRFVVRPMSSLATPEYHKLADSWLEAMYATFEDLIDASDAAADFDVTLANGVLTLRLGDSGTYVINKQTPNKQIWLSSPTTGPKRFDWVADRNQWVYSHDNIALDERLTQELGPIFNDDIDFTQHLHEA